MKTKTNAVSTVWVHVWKRNKGGGSVTVFRNDYPPREYRGRRFVRHGRKMQDLLMRKEG